MLSYNILKIKLLSIIGSIDNYTSEANISVPCETLKNCLEKDSLSLDVLEYCCTTISEWYENNISKVYSNQWVFNKEAHKQNKEEIQKIVTDIQEHKEEYNAFFSKPTISKNNPLISGSDIFIVHGHDSGLKNEVARFLEKLNFNPIILHEQASEGNTIIEKIERYSNVGFGIVLYTPCDRGGLATDESELKLRARQNVVFEHGYLIGRLGRSKVCALIKNEVEKPNDIAGVVYVSYDESGAWKVEIAKELKAAGYNIDFNQLF
ncbi:MAG: TIR domain-containing protein [Blautia sp.]